MLEQGTSLKTRLQIMHDNGLDEKIILSSATMILECAKMTLEGAGR